jgi:Zn finger protein HypA/HybF involved in hydrogenase expression
MYNFNINTAGFVIVGMFIVTWAAAMSHLALWPHRGEVGRPPQVVPDSLVFSWELLTADTDLEHCKLDIEHVPAVVACRPAVTGPHWSCRFWSAAPAAAADVELVTGDEFDLASFDVAAT